MKYLAVLTLGILTGLAMTRIPHYVNIYAEHSLPPDWEGPKVVGAWSEEDRAMLNRYYNGGK